ncbi:hypothetical protein [Erwinia tasmaniensis]|uniref:Lipoprotein n=1 Tax=Erwinia tasmaniensis (strain DSM 17950 / CFBP 7177 / CIP 109463 / NCPPB 4357 / Et1/99) TaxID=465817 RepID=B2VE27_ERWT9|nr:hypothetical protein [Erwinia tasmaniensis]CAO95927.1 hypothetical protein ETA_08810 [Erwinia tasmaniensis Et1/99]
MKTVYLALGLMMTGHAFAGSMTGSIGVKVVIYSQCNINGHNIPAHGATTIPCAGGSQVQPKITQSPLMHDAKTGRNTNLVTVEW